LRGHVNSTSCDGVRPQLQLGVPHIQDRWSKIGTHSRLAAMNRFSSATLDVPLVETRLRQHLWAIVYHLGCIVHFRAVETQSSGLF